MAQPNFELHESLKKDLSEESARMIAEVVPQAGDLATRSDVDRVEARIDQVEASLKAYIDSRLLRFTATIVVPMVLTMLGTVGALIALVVKI